MLMPSRVEENKTPVNHHRGCSKQRQTEDPSSSYRRWGMRTLASSTATLAARRQQASGLKTLKEDLPGGQVVGAPYFQGREHGFDSWLGN